MAKLTKAQREWLRKIDLQGRNLFPRPRYDVAGKMRDLGVINIVKERPDSELEWPWGNWRPEITEAGRLALSDQGGEG